ncbi:alpha/beta family hydrolase [Oceaniserpentilla sp. 4NH20-0058]|uniref:alpha/beta family hydrolase n=1 Tax=Oceaniserpentilla sp. 4NH20-0058 TaxID=3127660 RepID=UPI00333E52CC
MPLKIDGESNPLTCIFAHGAGAPMDSEFMETVTQGLVKLGVKVVRFEFPYMQERRVNGKKRPPNRQPELIAEFKSVVAQVNGTCVLMGKSLGARMASILASETTCPKHVLGVVAFGYPFHPIGKPETLRIAHLPDIQVPMLVLQGTRDKLGAKEYVAELNIGKKVQVRWLEDGDHDLKPRVKSGFTHEQHLNQAIEISAQFITQCFAQNENKI